MNVWFLYSPENHCCHRPTKQNIKTNATCRSYEVMMALKRRRKGNKYQLLQILKFITWTWSFYGRDFSGQCQQWLQQQIWWCEAAKSCIGLLTVLALDDDWEDDDELEQSSWVHIVCPYGIKKYHCSTTTFSKCHFQWFAPPCIGSLPGGCLLWLWCHMCGT